MATTRQVVLDEDVYDKVKAVAEREDRTIAKQTSRLLREALKGNEASDPVLNPF